MRKHLATGIVVLAALTGTAGPASAAVTLTVHPGQTLHIARLHVGDSIVCRTPTHSIRWKATAGNINSSGQFVWDKQLQLNITRRGSKLTAACQRRQ